MASIDKIRELVNHLQSKITTKEDIRCDEDNPTSPHHLLWMCKQVTALDEVTASLWVGYIQGVMLMENMIDVESEKKVLWDYVK